MPDPEELHPVFYGPPRPRPKRSRKHQSTLDLEAHIEHVHQLTINAINAKDFEITSQAWQHYAAEIETEIEVPPIRLSVWKCTLAEHLERHKCFSAHFPEWHVECIR